MRRRAHALLLLTRKTTGCGGCPSVQDGPASGAGERSRYLAKGRQGLVDDTANWPDRPSSMLRFYRFCARRWKPVLMPTGCQSLSGACRLCVPCWPTVGACGSTLPRSTARCSGWAIVIVVLVMT